MSRLTLFADIIVPLSVPNLYTYRVPVEMNDTLGVGMRVMVQFGKSKIYTGIVRHIHEIPPSDYEAKYIESQVDTQAIINQKQFEFWDWIAHYYMCYPGEVMNAALPSGLKLSSESKFVLSEEIGNFDLNELNANEYKVVEALLAQNEMSYPDITKLLEIKSVQPIIKSLRDKKIIFSYEEVKEKYKPKFVSYLTLADEYKDEAKLHELINQLEKKAFKQLEVLLAFLNYRIAAKQDLFWCKRNDLLKIADSAAINSLVKKNVFVQQEFEMGRLEFSYSDKTKKSLTTEQEGCYNTIVDSFKTNQTCLLHGITGSGKTEIYCKLIEDAIREGKQALYLVPEIALTTQLIYRIQAYFGDAVGVYHSRFNESERVEIYQDVLGQNETVNKMNVRNYKVILGPRSTLFLPFSNLGLIVIDEEHDASYKQHDPNPRYHARDAANYLARIHQAKVLLGSATPSIESFYKAKEKKYAYAYLGSRFGEAKLPEIRLVNKNEIIEKETEDKLAEVVKPTSLFTSELLNCISDSLKNKQQVILFLNRRGFAPYTECNQCAYTPQCVQCDVSLIYHKASNKLACHYCGYTINPPKTCNACGSTDLRHKGFGTEKIEEELELMYPDARIARMDLDSTRSKYAYKQLLDDFEEGNIDILTGTQMVTKGLDFDNVGLVGVIDADRMLSFPDFRSFEKGFQIMTQVAGRAGRGKKKGLVIIQTIQPEHQVLKWIQSSDYNSLYENQIADREEFKYPPFYRLIEFEVSAKDKDLLQYAADSFAASLRGIFKERVLGPEYPLVTRVRGMHVKRIILKTEQSFSYVKVREELNKIIFNFKTDNTFKTVVLKINVDPI